MNGLSFVFSTNRKFEIPSLSLLNYPFKLLTNKGEFTSFTHLIPKLPPSVSTKLPSLIWKAFLRPPRRTSTWLFSRSRFPDSTQKEP